jgi:signal transduction histidine kinase
MMKNSKQNQESKPIAFDPFKKRSAKLGQIGLQRKLQLLELEFLNKIELFKYFERDTLLRIIRESPVWLLEKEDILFDGGNEGQNSMFIILAGKVMVYKANKMISYLGAGDYVGEMPLVDSESRSASVKSNGETLLMEINEAIFHKHIASNSNALLAMMKVFINRTRKDLTRLETDMRKMSCFTHDMRNVLVPLRNSEVILKDVLRLLNGTQSYHKRRDAYNDLKIGVDTMLGVHSNLNAMIEQSLACVKRQRGEYIKEDFDIIALINETIREISCHKHLKHKTIKVVSPELKINGCFNYLDIKRVLQNLIINAGHATQEVDQILCHVKNGRDEIEISIEDKGSGIPDDIKPLLLRENYTSKIDGNGMGLISCREIIEKFHKGNIGFKSELHKGTTFYFTLPKFTPDKPNGGTSRIVQKGLQGDNMMLRKLELLEKIDLLNCLPPETKESLAMESRDLALKKGDVLIKECSIDEQYLHIILRGKVRVCKGLHNQKFIADLKAGEYLGEFSLIDCLPRSASAVALTDVLVAEIDKKLFEKHITSNSKALLEMLKVCSRRLRNDLEAMSRDLQQLSHFTHDMKNCLVPLGISAVHLMNVFNKLRGTHECHKKRKGHTRVKRGFDIMSSVKCDMVSMIHQSLACVQKESREYAKRKIDIFHLAREAIREIKYHKDLKNKTIRFVGVGSGAAGFINALDIKRVLYNLILNAGYFSPPKSGIEVCVKELYGSIEVSVKDKGVGVSEDIRPHLFKENFTSKPGGDGLGLMSCKDIIEEYHHGKIGFRSQIGKGSTFFFNIPIGQ